MAAGKRVVWKGAISFGLVNIPVALHTAVGESGLDFDWLDKRSMEPVGYKRINKRTGEEMLGENIVRGIAYDRDQYVVLTDEEIRASLPQTTQMIEIESFVATDEIPLLYFERPYYLVPVGQADKAYALLRETLARTQRAGIARVVLHTKQHLAALLPAGPVLMLVLLRWANQIRPVEELGLQAASEFNPKELDIARQLVDTMTEAWQPHRFTDSFRAQVMALVEEKARTGHIETVPAIDDGSDSGAEVIDLTELLRRSLQAKRLDRDKQQAAKKTRVRRKG